MMRARGRVVHAQASDEERKRREQEAREKAAMMQPVEKRRRSVPWKGYQEKQMELSPHEGKLYYFVPGEEKRREILLQEVVQLRPKEEKKTSSHMLVIMVRSAKGTKDAKFKLRFANELARDAWLKQLRQFCPNAVDAA